ncbi:MAG TPA: hypothetical protein VLB80_02680 [Candidatus Babeliales bacterium]|nr:hypothetical protein [Candidatus Babeliales bacterium]
MRTLMSRIFKKNKVTFFVNLLVFFVSISGRDINVSGRLALGKEESSQLERDATNDMENEEIVALKSDRYTQTEAHLQLENIRKLIRKNYQVEPYLGLIATVLANEAKYKNTHYAFYNTTSNVWRLAQDLYTRLYAYENPIDVKKDFKFLRFGNEAINSTAQSFLINELKSKGLVDDNTETGAILLSVNLSLFGNVGFPGECSWEYFVKPQGHKTPDRELYENMMDRFGLSHNYIDELISLVNIYDTKEDTIIQVLVPQDKIDEIGYLAWVKGIPAHGDTINWILKNAKSKSFTRHVSPLMEKLTDKFAKEKNTNPLYKDMMEGIEEGEFSLASFLKIYRNTPWKIKEINDVTGRLLFTPNVLLNPESDVKFYRFSMVEQDKLRAYNRKLNIIIDKLIAEKEIKPVQVEVLSE